MNHTDAETRFLQAVDATLTEKPISRSALIKKIKAGEVPGSKTYPTFGECVDLLKRIEPKHPVAKVQTHYAELWQRLPISS